MPTTILGVYARYRDAQRVRHDMILSGYSSAEIEVASSDELEAEQVFLFGVPDHVFVLLLRSLHMSEN